MKKTGLRLIVLLALFSLLCIAQVSSLEIDIQKTSYYPQETLQAEITGGFIDPLILENIGIYREGQLHKTPAESGIINLNNKYLYYAVLPSTPGSYTLKIENTEYYEGSVETNKTSSKQFTIAGTNESYLSISPGFIYTTKDFSITIKAFNKEQRVNVELPETNFKQSFNMSYNMEKTVYFSISSLNNSLTSKIKINNYNIPAIIIPDKSIYAPKPPKYYENLIDVIKIYPEDLNATLIKDSISFFQIYIKNRYAGESIDGLNISSSNPDITIDPKYIESVDGTKEINITIKATQDMKEYLNLSVLGSYAILPISIKVTNNLSEVDSTINPANKDKTCAEMNGAICNYEAGETCDSLAYDALNKPCCLSVCKASSSSGGWWWGVLILIILIIVGFLFWRRSNKGGSNRNEKQFFSKKVDEFKARMNPGSTEVRKSLSRE